MWFQCVFFLLDELHKLYNKKPVFQDKYIFKKLLVTFLLKEIIICIPYIQMISICISKSISAVFLHYEIYLNFMIKTLAL